MVLSCYENVRGREHGEGQRRSRRPSKDGREHDSKKRGSRASSAGGVMSKIRLRLLSPGTLP